MAKANKSESTVKKKISIQFTKEQILKFKKYENRIDLLNALLDDGKKYTKAEVEDAVKAFMKGKVI